MKCSASGAWSGGIAILCVTDEKHLGFFIVLCLYSVAIAVVVRRFKEDVETLYAKLPPRPQHMLWSATMPEWIQRLVHTFLYEPEFVDLVGSDAPALPATIDHHAVLTEESRRMDAFGKLIQDLVQRRGKRGEARGSILAFTETKLEAEQIASLSVPQVRLGAITGDRSQFQREKTLESFRKGRIDVLCATDVAARGIDLPGVSAVVHFRMPRETSSFVHRSGRTGRAGESGLNFVLASSSELGACGFLEDVRCLLGLIYFVECAR